jgi:dTDP-4-amino-4,6-dideoxygalactose transaminase
MGARSAVAWRLPPVRRAVPLARVPMIRGRRAFLDRVGPGSVELFSSGTDALAWALQRARGKSTVGGEVILPAYGCPDLVTACEMAGLVARLVDCRSGSWGYDPEALRAALSDRTIAVLSVDLLGLAGWDQDTARALAGHPARLIEDCAQSFPFFATPREWAGRDVVFSFGRGKPVNAMGGGALFTPGQEPPEPGPGGSGAQPPQRGGFHAVRFAARGAAFNLLSHPAVYWMLERLPFLGLGETRYKPPRPVTRAPDELWEHVGAGILDIESRQADAMMVWMDYLQAWPGLGVTPLLSADAGHRGHSMLRLPVLASDRDHRDTLVGALRRLGVGVSLMYGTALNEVSGVPSAIAGQGPFPGAKAFSDRLLTLPVHGHLSRPLAAATDRVIRQVAQS